MPILSHARHEAFAQAIVAGLLKGTTQAEAYQSAGYKASAESARRCASRLLTIADHVAARVKELQGQAAKRKKITVDSIVDELEEAREVGKANDQAAAMVAATSTKAKILGLSVERTEIGKPGDFTQADTTKQVADQLLKQAGIATDSVSEEMAEGLRGRALEALARFNGELSALAQLAAASEQSTASA